MTPSDTLRYLNTVNSAASIDALNSAFVAEAEQAGFTACACSVFSFQSYRTANPRILVGCLPAEWVTIYYQRDYARDDPLALRARRAMMPFSWSEVPPSQGSGRSNEIRAGRAAFNLTDGLVVPIHTPGGKLGWVHYLGHAIDESPERRNLLQLVALATFNRALELTHATPAPKPRLTEREVECLRWITAGKSDCDIGDILNISKRTVHFHVENAKRKLESSTRVQAVVAALGRNLIEL